VLFVGVREATRAVRRIFTMSQSKRFVVAFLAIAAVAGVLLVESFAKSRAPLATNGSGPVKPVPWAHG
jgi:hypothetical protein